MLFIIARYYTHKFKVFDRMFLVEDHCQLEACAKTTFKVEASITDKIIEFASIQEEK